jgi:hypothetical protein
MSDHYYHYSLFFCLVPAAAEALSSVIDADHDQPINGVSVLEEGEWLLTYWTTGSSMIGSHFSISESFRWSTSGWVGCNVPWQSRWTALWVTFEWIANYIVFVFPSDLTGFNGEQATASITSQSNVTLLEMRTIMGYCSFIVIVPMVDLMTDYIFSNKIRCEQFRIGRLSPH